MPLFLFFIFLVSPVRADLSKDYARYVLERIDVLRALGEKVKNTDPALCPKVGALKHSDCYFEALKKTQIKTSTELALLLNIGISAIGQDKKSLQMDPVMAVAITIQYSLIALESVDVRKFHVLEIKSADSVGLALLRKTEEDMLRKSAGDILKILDGEFAKLDAEIAKVPAGAELLPAMKAKAEHLRGRQALLRKRAWSLAEASAPPPPPNPVTSPFTRPLCAPQVHKACQIAPIPECQRQVIDLVHDCMKTASKDSSREALMECTVTAWMKKNNVSPRPQCREAIRITK